MSRVFITGYGIISAIGKNSEENYQSLINRKTGYGKLEIIETLHRDDLPGCEVKYTDGQLCELAGVSAKIGFTRTALLGAIAAGEALHMAALTSEEKRNAGIVSATTTGGIRELERYYYELQDNAIQGDFSVFVDTGNPGEHTERIATLFGLKGYISTVSTACSSSANTIMMGAELIKNGVLDIALCGGADAMTKFTLNGFNTLLILDKEQCRPFDNTRSGLNLGEGAAYLVLESEASAKKSGRKIIAEVLGYGNTNDAFHQTASSPDGSGAYHAMNNALQSGSIAPSAVSYINAHGTATVNNDLSEGLAMQKLFGDTMPMFSSTKPYTGHTLAAAGSIEAVFCMMALQHNVIFPSINYAQQMEELTIAPTQQLVRDVKLDYILSNSFGFGGNASSLLFAAVQE